MAGQPYLALNKYLNKYILLLPFCTWQLINSIFSLNFVLVKEVKNKKRINKRFNFTIFVHILWVVVVYDWIQVQCLYGLPKSKQVISRWKPGICLIFYTCKWPSIMIPYLMTKRGERKSSEEENKHMGSNSEIT